MKVWLWETTGNKDPVRRRWELLVRLVQRTLRERNPPEDLTRATMFLTLKGKGGFWGIGIIEVAWEVSAAVVNCRLKRRFVLHGALNKFRVG